MKFALRTHAVAAMMVLAPMAATMVAEPAAAQQRAVVAPSIRALTVNADRGLDAGSLLQLRVQATPGARWANVTLGNSGIRVPLRETSAGNYYGSYRITRGSNIDPFELITARAHYGSRTVAVNYSWPPAFQAGAVGAGPAPEIERFVARTGSLRPGSDVRFRLVGEPASDVRVRVPGVLSGLRMDEIRPGVYEASYTIRRGDNLEAFDRAVAILEKDGQRATARVDTRGRGWDDDRFGNRGLPLEVTSHRDNAVIDVDGNLRITGHTAPHADVRVQVEAVNVMAGMLGMNPGVTERVVRADANGDFTVWIPRSGIPFPGTRYDVQLTATRGNQVAEQSLTLVTRG